MSLQARRWWSMMGSITRPDCLEDLLKNALATRIASVLALGLVQYGLYLLEQPAARLAGLYQSGITVLTLSFQESLAIIGIGVLLGLVGSWFAAARHMRRIEPR